MIRYSGQVRCAGCRKLTARDTATAFGVVMYGPCCWEKKRSAAANGWTCLDCGQILPEEDMITADLCRRCVRRVPAQLRDNH